VEDIDGLLGGGAFVGSRFFALGGHFFFSGGFVMGGWVLGDDVEGGLDKLDELDELVDGSR